MVVTISWTVGLPYTGCKTVHFVDPMMNTEEQNGDWLVKERVDL